MKTKHLLSAGILALSVMTLAPAHAALVYVADNFGNKVGKYDAITGASDAGWVSPSGLIGPHGLALSGNYLFVSNESGTVGKYDATTGAAIPGWTSPGG